MMNCYKLEDLFVGAESQFQVEITEEKVCNFCELCGDENPLHKNTEFAKKHGFESRVVYGLLTTTYISTMVGIYLPGKNSLLQSICCDFLKPVYIGDKLTVIGTVQAIHKTIRQIVINISILNQNNTKVLRGRASVLMI